MDVELSEVRDFWPGTRRSACCPRQCSTGSRDGARCATRAGARWCWRSGSGGRALRRALRAIANLQLATSGTTVLGAVVGELVARAPVTVDAGASVADASAVMSRAGVSSLLVVDGTGLCGLVTDRDLRNRVLAVGLDPGRPVREVMTGLVAGAGRGRALLVVQVRTGLDLFTGTPRVSRDGSKSPLEASCEIGLA